MERGIRIPYAIRTVGRSTLVLLPASVLALGVACADHAAAARDERARVTGRPQFTAPDGSASGLRRVRDAAAPANVSVAAVPAGLVVRFAIDTEGRCVAPHSVEHRVQGDMVDITVFSDRPAGCLAVFTPEEFEVRVDGLHRGRHVVRVSFEQGEASAELAAVDTVHVPDLR